MPSSNDNTTLKPTPSKRLVYSDPDTFQRDVKRFQNSWQFFCHESEIPKPGDYICQNWAGEEIFVIRTVDGDIKGFFNICPHRGSRLLDEHLGNIPEGRIICSFHGWNFSDSGSLLTTGNTQFSKSQSCKVGLKSVQVSIIFGMVFVTLGEPEVDLAGQMAIFSDELSALKDPELIPTSRSIISSLKTNWRFFSEISLDDTHVPQVHRSSRLLMAGSSGYRHTQLVRRWHQNFFSLKDSAVDLRPAVDVVLYYCMLKFLKPKNNDLNFKWIYYWIFPSMEISIYPEQIELRQIVPVSPTENYTRSRFFGARSKNPIILFARVLNQKIQDRIDKEDRAQVLKQQGVASSFPDARPIVGEKEKLVARFHSYLDIGPESLNE